MGRRRGWRCALPTLTLYHLGLAVGIDAQAAVEDARKASELRDDQHARWQLLQMACLRADERRGGVGGSGAHGWAGATAP